MTQKSRTKDEQFLIKLYEETKNSADGKDEFDKYVIGAQVGMQEKGVNSTCVLLHKANFVKKLDDNKIAITPHGQKIAEEILKS